MDWSSAATVLVTGFVAIVASTVPELFRNHRDSKAAAELHLESKRERERADREVLRVAILDFEVAVLAVWESIQTEIRSHSGHFKFSEPGAPLTDLESAVEGAKSAAWRRELHLRLLCPELAEPARTFNNALSDYDTGEMWRPALDGFEAKARPFVVPLRARKEVE